MHVVTDSAEVMRTALTHPLVHRVSTTRSDIRRTSAFRPVVEVGRGDYLLQLRK